MKSIPGKGMINVSLGQGPVGCGGEQPGSQTAAEGAIRMSEK